MHSLCKVASIDSKWRVLAQSGEYWVLLATLASTKIQSIFQSVVWTYLHAQCKRSRLLVRPVFQRSKQEFAQSVDKRHGSTLLHFR